MNPAWRPAIRLSIAFALASTASIAGAQTLGQGDAGISPWRVLAALILCIGLAVAAAFALRFRMGHRGMTLLRPPTKRLQLIDTLRLGPTSSLYVVRYDRRDYLIMTGPQGSTIVESELAADAADQADPA